MQLRSALRSSLSGARSWFAERAAWLVLGESMLVWCSGNVLYSLFLPDDIPVPSIADVAWLAAYPGFCAGLWLLFGPV
jgi:hypothetical protein